MVQRLSQSLYRLIAGKTGRAISLGGLLLLITCSILAQPARVTVVVFDEFGRQLRFRINAATSRKDGALRVPRDFRTQQELQTPVFDEVTVEISVERFERFPLTRTTTIVSPQQLVVFDHSTMLADHTALAVFKPARLRLPAFFCALDDGGLRWAEIKKVGRPDTIRNVRVTDCTLELGKLLPSSYMVTIYERGRPLGVSDFTVAENQPAEVMLDLDRQPRHGR